MNAARATLAATQAQALADFVAIWAAAEVEVVAVRAEVNEAIKVAQADAEKAAEDEFRVGFFQGYTDLKRRVAMAYLEWDLSSFSGVNSNYWDMEVSVEEGDPAMEDDTSAAADTGS